jgi:hypothetical protein
MGCVIFCLLRHHLHDCSPSPPRMVYWVRGVFRAHAGPAADVIAFSTSASFLLFLSPCIMIIVFLNRRSPANETILFVPQRSSDMTFDTIAIKANLVDIT